MKGKRLNWGHSDVKAWKEKDRRELCLKRKRDRERVRERERGGRVRVIEGETESKWG